MKSHSLLLFFLIFTCNLRYLKAQDAEILLPVYMSQIDTLRIKSHLEFLADDLLEGRDNGEKGQFIAGLYLKSQLQSLGFEPLFKDSLGTTFFQNFEFGKISPRKTFNVGGVLRGSEFPNEYVVLSAHYDHIGMGKSGIYNGADDNASGTSTLLELARIFAKIKNDGYSTKKSIIILFFSGEEKGLLGSDYFSDNPAVPLKSIITDLNVDMVGRIDEKHQKSNNPNYIYVIGSNFLSQKLHDINEKVNQDFLQMELDYTYNKTNHPEKLYYRSDHYNFAKHNIPVIFYFSGLHEDYHKPTDTVEKIIYGKTLTIAKLIFGTAYRIAFLEGNLMK